MQNLFAYLVNREFGTLIFKFMGYRVPYSKLKKESPFDGLFINLIISIMATLILSESVDLITVDSFTYELDTYADVCGLTRNEIISSIPEENIERIY